ncbi:type II toxin-antitoxin system PemK/MazF family toxin [Desulfobulbus alkaliphilus]|uniref:type II toxin-antitoxin system PemK/MazF family toxin n=1 Tax=Desulfobulbus alkaliphilus TaxID=869814 RepID=UPI00196499A0|nr:type II toxin-antitoxin system PemK/MazF family toxin [Desulfobulbus alkaliphilus]
MKRYIPQRGDIIWTDFDPAAGHEQKGKRPALVLSPERFNKKILLALVAPITSRVRGHAFEVPLPGQKVAGVVLCQQVKTIDFVACGVFFAEKAETALLNEVLAKVRAIIS